MGGAEEEARGRGRSLRPVGASVRAGRPVLLSMSAHPRDLGKSWLRSIRVSSEAERRASEREPAGLVRAPPPRAAAQLELVPTMDELVRLAVLPRVHRLCREEWSAWNAADEDVRAEARRAIREAVREAGGGALADPRGKTIETIA